MNAPVVAKIEVRCSLAHAFEVFTSKVDMWWPARHRKFDTSVLRFERRLGGRFFERSPTGEENDFGQIVAWEPPNRFAYTWYPGAIDKPTEVGVTFRHISDVTAVTVNHTEAKSELGEAWANVLPAFKEFIEHAPTISSPDSASEDSEPTANSFVAS